MTPVRALEILTALRDGVDPVVGDSLRPASPCQQPDVVRALYVACERLTRPVGATARAANSGQRWTPEEDARLAAGHEAGRTPAALATEHGRSTNAVKLRLERLGCIAPGTSGVTQRFGAPQVVGAA